MVIIVWDFIVLYLIKQKKNYTGQKGIHITFFWVLSLRYRTLSTELTGRPSTTFEPSNCKQKI